MDAVVQMPNGEFEFWDDYTQYTREYHVAQTPKASDDNDGSAARPFRTIGRAAALAGPGEKVVIHAGEYRELVRPARGGEGPDRMIAYQAALGEKVVVKGSRLWRPEVRPSEGWNIHKATGPIYMADIPSEWVAQYNPFALTSVFAHLCEFCKDWARKELEGFQMRRGMFFAGGQALGQVLHARDLAARDGAFWVEDAGLRIHFRLPGDADPQKAHIELAVQEQVFAPAQRHMGYVRISGIAFEHAADGVPVPQRAMVSTYRGHHWIIEDCRLAHANAVGMDIGNEDWRASAPPIAGGHIVRRNHISHCGVCGLAGVGSVDGSLVEDNVIEHIGGRFSERLYESAGCKLHVAKGVLIRRNVFRHTREASGLWLDYLNENCRVTGNVFADIETILAGTYLEVSHAPNWIDGNVYWDIRGPGGGAGPQAPGIVGAMGVSADTGEGAVVANNFFSLVRHGYAIGVHLNQRDRMVGNRNGLCRRNAATDNVIVACPRRVFFAQPAENRADGNVYDVADKAGSFYIAAPTAHALDLAAWREFFGLDAAGSEVQIEANLDVETLTLRLAVQATPGQVKGTMPQKLQHAAAGPFTPQQWEKILSGGLKMQLPLR